MKVLYPLSLLYFLAIKIRNWLFDKGIYKEYQFSVKTINVGNLTVGGTGKTPHVEYLIRLLNPSKKIATLSRGYGRKTKGFLEATETSTAEEIGDEPLQFYKKFHNKVNVTVGEERLFAIPKILDLHPHINVILLDDAYQHRFVKPHINILLTDYNLLFYNDLMLPAGRLREDAAGASRANIIVVSKCPSQLADTTTNQITEKIKKYNPKAPVFFSSIRYLSPVSLFDNFKEINKDVIVLTGIAKANLMLEFIRKSHNVLHHLEFNDHHAYTKEDMQQLIKVFNNYPPKTTSIITTEKDMVKLTDVALREFIENLPIYYLPIEIYFLKDEQRFNELIINGLN